VIDRAGCAAELLIKAILRLQRLILGPQQFRLGRARHQQEQTLCLKRLFNEI
jgi:hypothetical protein